MVKNIVKDVLGDKVVPQYKGKKLSSRFIRELGWGTDSEVVFVRSEDDVELASVMYNAPIKEDGSKAESAVKETRTFTTNQRPKNKAWMYLRPLLLTKCTVIVMPSIILSKRPMHPSAKSSVAMCFSLVITPKKNMKAHTITTPQKR